MGVLRKTASIATLGVVNFRSKKERLARAERALTEVSSARKAEKLARQVAESGLSKVEGELHRLSKAEAKAARQLRRLRRRRPVKRAERLTEVLASVPVQERVSHAREAFGDVADEGRKRGRRAKKAARRAAKELRAGAERAMDQGRAALQS